MSFDLPVNLVDVIDDKTGAVYGCVAEDVFSVLPLRYLKKIGEGSTGDVLLMEVTYQPIVKMAAKVFPLCEEEKKKDKKWKTFLWESAFLQELKHKNIVKIVGSITCPQYSVILMEYFPDGPLYKVLQKLDDNQIQRYFMQISFALRHVHSKRIVHRDIKLDNILLRNDTAYLTDFGLSQKLPPSNSKITGHVGTPEFMAPEVRMAELGLEYDGFKADSFCMGVFLWCLLMRYEPTEFTPLWGTIKYKVDVFNPTLMMCIRRLLKTEPKNRWDITLLLNDLEQNGYPLHLFEK